MREIYNIYKSPLNSWPFPSLHDFLIASILKTHERTNRRRFWLPYPLFSHLHYGVHLSLKKDKYRRESKGRRCCLGDGLKCSTNHLAARKIWAEVFGRTSILVGWWFVMVRTRWLSIFLKHPFRQVNSIHPYFSKSSWWKISKIRQGIESITFSKHKRRLLPSLLSLSFFYETCTPIQRSSLTCSSCPGTAACRGRCRSRPHRRD